MKTKAATGLGAQRMRLLEARRAWVLALRPLLLDFEKKLAEVVRECPGIFRGEDESDVVSLDRGLAEVDKSAVGVEGELVSVAPAACIGGDGHECIVRFKVRDGKLVSYGLTGCEALGGPFVRRLPRR